MAAFDVRFFAIILASPSCWALNNRTRISAAQEHDAASELPSVLLARVYFFPSSESRCHHFMASPSSIGTISPVRSSSPSDPSRRVFTDCHLPLRVVFTRHQGLLARPIVASLFAGEVVPFNSLPHGLKTRPPSETAAFLGRSCRRAIRRAAGGVSVPSPLAPRHHQRPRPRPPAEEQTADTPAEENARVSRASDADEATSDTSAERHLGADLDDDDVGADLDDSNIDVQLPSPPSAGLRGDPRDPGQWTGAFEAFAARPIDDQMLVGDADGDGGSSSNGALTDGQLHERRLDDLFDMLSMAPYFVVRRTSTKVRHAELVGRTTHDPFTSLPRLFFCDSLTPYSLPLLICRPP